jgi:hypothetical protein
MAVPMIAWRILVLADAPRPWRILGALFQASFTVQALRRPFQTAPKGPLFRSPVCEKA